MANVESFKEIVPLLDHDRADVRKEVLKVFGSFVQDPAVVDYLLEHELAAVKKVTEMLVHGEATKVYIHGVLLVLIHLSDKGACSRTMIEARAVQRTMLLLEKGGLKTEVQELCLILLANLTSVSVEAANAVLQTETPALEGFYVSQLLRRFVDEHGDAKDMIVKPTEADGFIGGGRDRSKWVANILCNCVQCDAGRRLILEEDDALERFRELMGVKDDQLRASVTSLVKNLLHEPTAHPKLIEKEVVSTVVGRIVNEEEKNQDILDVVAAAVRCVTHTKPGTEYLDGCGAKKYLQEILPNLTPSTSACEDVKFIIDKLDDVQDITAVVEPTPEELAEKAAAKKKAQRKRHAPIPTPTGHVEEVDSDVDDEDLMNPGNLIESDDEEGMAELD
eukprot:TRINITY_DN28310_c0_g1_i1.p1 TRINITY_DN28310_c0_g1~~TRINITY_DN28310_c0_g1_i1.p1  ORF type:complete len:418 (+),score=218.56 TRINITY_DN28310_c0_g1_i1:81-1256(+)